MERSCAMVNSTSTVALKEEQIELELGLSIGRGYQRPEKLKPVKKETVRVQLTSNSNSDGSEADPYDKNHRHQNNNLQSCPRSSVSPPFVIDKEQETDPRVKREIQAARRQEAKKKREEKQHKNRICKGQNGDYVNEFDMKLERKCKRSKLGDSVDAGSGSNDEIENGNGKMTCEQNRDCNLFSNPTACIASQMPQVGLMQNQLLPLQCVPITNGSAYPCMMRCGAESGACVGSERKVIRPSPKRSVGPVQAMSESVLSLSMCSSSTVSENHSFSQQQGGSGSDTTSNSNVSFVERNQNSGTKERAENAVLAHLLESAESINKPTNRIDQPASDATESKPKEEPVSVTKPHNPSRNLISTPETTQVPNTFRETKGNNVGKPPKPVNSNRSTTSPIPLMPFVSTTGNGPNGKTINGFLYRYTKSDVSIICVCHGITFSPAEFVQHAGCTDLSQPLRHITVIPSAV